MRKLVAAPSALMMVSLVTLLLIDCRSPFYANEELLLLGKIKTVETVEPAMDTD